MVHARNHAHRLHICAKAVSRVRAKNKTPQVGLPAVAAHGATRLPSVDVNSYNVELKDDEGFLGDRASKAAFRDIIENWRSAMRKLHVENHVDLVKYAAKTGLV